MEHNRSASGTVGSRADRSLFIIAVVSEQQTHP
jgi:hypothetical protein